MSGSFSKSSIGRKILMALSGIFLMFFLLQHLVINSLSLVSEDLFNSASHFMGTNPLVQFVLQPILLFGVLFHLFMGVYLDIRNRKARPTKYYVNSSADNSNWVSRNMIYTGLTIMLFLGLHFYDFWIPEINEKFIKGNWDDPTRYFPHLQHKFHDTWRVLIYCFSFVFLSLHLLHGFQSSFKSTGMSTSKYTYIIRRVSVLYAILVPLGFVIIALFHYFIR